MSATICISREKTAGQVKCENPSKHHAELEDAGKIGFIASPEEFDYWEKIQRLRRENISREYLETGECLLCLIDKSIEGKF
jgi:hypothetical protein